MKNFTNIGSKSVVVAALFIVVCSVSANAQNIIGATSTCPVVTKFMKFGEVNDKSEVSRLQNFLKNTEKLDVNVTGDFDLKTEEAVMEFQKKYRDIILAPWKAGIPSGSVYITTIKQINKIACATPLTLNPSDLAIINAYQAKTSDVTVLEARSIGSRNGDDIASTTGSDSNVAAVGGTSVAGKFLSFLKGLFR